jgi:hypothetical protein
VENPLTATDQAWCDDLLLALRLRDVPGPRIGEVLAEVQSHVAETGEDPRQAFGSPKEYADAVAGALGVTPGTLRDRVRRGDLVLALTLGLAGFLLADSLWSLGAGDRGLLGLPAWLLIAVAVLVLGGGIVRLVTVVRRTPDRVVDPRTGADMVPFAGWRVALLVALPVVGLGAMLVGGLLARS